MYIKEVREILKSYSAKDMKVLIAEMYKAMPKKLREEKNIDEMVRDVQAFKEKNKRRKKTKKKIDLDFLEIDVEEFVDYAYKQYYFAPNSYVHKKERSKWRFKVKRFINDLYQVGLDDEEGEVATLLLQQLYEVLTYGCAYVIFSSDNPFRSVGIEQTSLLNGIIKRKFSYGINDESVKTMIELVINNYLDTDTLYSDLFKVLIENLSTADAKQVAINQCDEVLKEVVALSNSEHGSEYNKRRKVNNLVEMALRLSIELHEIENGINYYWKNNMEQNKEVSLYILLRILFEYGLKDYWVQEYERVASSGIDIREKLNSMYEYIQENDKLPESIF